MDNKSKNTANTLLIVGLVLVALYFGKTLLIPFIIALVAWYLLNSLKKVISKIRINRMEMPRFIQSFIAVLTLGGIIFFLGELIKVNFEEFVEVYPKYHEAILNLFTDLNEKWNLPIEMSDFFSEIDLQEPMAGLLDSSFGFVTNIFLILIYVAFLGTEQQTFDRKLKLIYKNKLKLKKFREITSEIDASVRTYLTIKTSLCLLLAVSSYILLFILDIDFAILWAFLIFLLNFIPIIGPAICVLLPTLLALLQFPESPSYPIIVVCVLGVIHLAVGNFIEPKVLGNRLNLSPLVVIMALVFWGALWGIAGMFLCVPITVILMIVFRQFPQTKNMSILLSAGKESTGISKELSTPVQSDHN